MIADGFLLVFHKETHHISKIRVWHVFDRFLPVLSVRASQEQAARLLFNLFELGMEFCKCVCIGTDSDTCFDEGILAIAVS